MRRFLLHALPSHFVKIRHLGLVAAANVNTKLESARRCLQAPGHDDLPQNPPAQVEPSWRDLYFALTGIDLQVCPVCGARAMERRTLPSPVPGFGGLDTS